MPTTLDVFVSSKMLELQPEREVLYKLIPKLMKGTVELRPWVYETVAPASNDSTRQVYLNALRDSVLYIGLFWNQYGVWTIDEFDQATAWGIDRLVFIKDIDTQMRDARLSDFLNRNSDVLSSPASKWFRTEDELQAAVLQSIEAWAIGRLSKEPARRERLHHLKVHRKPLWDALREYEDYLTDHPTTSSKDEIRHQRIIRNARITCKAINDRGDAECERCLSIHADESGFIECSHRCEKKLAYIATLRLTPNLVIGTEGPREKAEVDKWGWYGNRNINALHDAVDRLEELIRYLEK